jgi:hypothetical protein
MEKATNGAHLREALCLKTSFQFPPCELCEVLSFFLFLVFLLSLLFNSSYVYVLLINRGMSDRFIQMLLFYFVYISSWILTLLVSDPDGFFQLTLTSMWESVQRSSPGEAPTPSSIIDLFEEVGVTENSLFAVSETEEESSPPFIGRVQGIGK